MGQADRQRDTARANRMDDPHGWADRVEQELGARSVAGAIALILGLFLAANVWLLWKERDAQKERLDVIEGFLGQRFPTTPAAGSPASPR